MKIKKVTAADTQSALRQVKEILGEDAIILHVQEVPGGGRKRKAIEVTAALDDDRKLNRDVGAQLFTRPQMDPDGSVARINKLLGKSAQPETEDLDLFKTPFPGTVSRQTVSVPAQELDDVRSSLDSLSKLLQSNGHPEFPPHYMDAYADLLGRGVEQRIAAVLVATVEKEKSRGKSRKSIRTALTDTLERFIAEFAPPAESARKGQKVVALVGPTGVGKTTCIAKLSAIDTIYNKLKVGLISADTYRIGAIEQLRTYADITKLELAVVYNPDEMNEAVQKFADCDVIYVDTPGRSQRNSEALIELTRFLKHCDNLEISLVLSLTSQLQNLRDVVQNYSILPVANMICTKYDESETVGIMLSLLEQCGRPISFISNGQNVPEDIVDVAPRSLAELIMGEKDQ